MSARPVRLAALALFLAALLGAAVGGISNLSAVSMADPRPSDGPLSTPVPAPTATPTPAPTPTPSPTPTATPSPKPQAKVWLYTVQVGDSMSGIAIRFGTTAAALLALNPEYVDHQNLVRAGAQMILPCTSIAATENRC